MGDTTNAEPETNGSSARPKAAVADEEGSPELNAESHSGEGEAQSENASGAPTAASFPAPARKGFDLAAFIRVSWVPALLLVLLGLTIAGIIVGLHAEPADAFGKFCIIAAVPLLSIAIGFFGNRFFSDVSARETLRKDVQMAAYTTYHLQSSVGYVDERVGYALLHLLEGSANDALLHLVSAKTATELAFGVSQQSASQLEMISPTGASAAKNIFSADRVDARPKIIPGNEPKLGKPGD